MESRSRSNRATQIPIACSLTPAELGGREQAWDKVLRTSLLSRERIAGGIRLTVHPAAMSSVRELVDLERECCPWINFSFEHDSLILTAPGAGEELLVRMFG